jgi:hypothetical protein
MLVFLLAIAAHAASTCTVTSHYVDGRRHWLLDIAETGARDTTEVACVGVPVCGQVARVDSALTDGTGTTVRPRLGKTASFVADSISQVTVAGSVAAATVQDAGSSPYCGVTTLYFRSGVNSTATDHTITSSVIILAGVHQ